MYNMKSLLGFYLVFIFSTVSFSQQYFVEFIVNEVNTFEKAKEVEFKIRSNSDYDMVRMDFNTGRCFIILKEKIKVTELSFKDEFNKIGYKISCFYIGIRGSDPFLEIKRGHCY